MNVLLKVRAFSALLEHKKLSVISQVAEIEHGLMEIDTFFQQLLNEYEAVDQQIKSITSCGVVKRTDIYRNIRQKGVLLSRKQLITHQISMLYDERFTQEKKLQQKRLTNNFFDKKINKLSRFLSKSDRESRIRYDNNNEAELQETYCHVRKKF